MSSILTFVSSNGIIDDGGVTSPTEKICGTCKETLPLVAFSPANRRSALSGMCRNCCREKDFLRGNTTRPFEKVQYYDKATLIDGTNPLIEPGEIWANPVKFDVKVPGYAISSHGRIVGKSDTLLIQNCIRNTPITQGATPEQHRAFQAVAAKLGGVKRYANISMSIDTNEVDLGYAYVQPNPRIVSTARSVTVDIHRLVIETFKPIDENPPFPLDIWNATPIEVREYVKACSFVDHIDGDLLNNHIDNLNWVTPRANNSAVKKKASL